MIDHSMRPQAETLYVLRTLAEQRPRAVSQLPPKQRRVTELALEGKSRPEIAADMGIGRATVQQHTKWASIVLGREKPELLVVA